MRYFILLFIWISCCLLTARAQSLPEARAHLDSNALEIGNPMGLRINISATNGWTPVGIDFSSWDSIVPKDNILKQSDWKQNPGSWTKDVFFTVFDSGEYRLEPLRIALKLGNQEAAVMTNALTLTVSKLPQTTQDPLPIKSIVEEPKNWTDFIPHMIIVGIILACAVFLYFWLNKSKKTPPPVTQVIEIPPGELALRKLEALRRKKLWESGDLKAYYSELTFITREYLEKRFAIPALESTTEEICEAVVQRDFPRDLVPELRQTLNYADFAKFAKGEPPADFHEKALELAEAVVRRGA